MVIYVDGVFLLNVLTDAASLYAVGRLAGRRRGWRRILPPAVLGGVYGVACLLPGLEWLAGPLWQAMGAVVLVRLTFGRGGGLCRLVVLFYLVSCALGGAVTGLWSILAQRGTDGAGLNWHAFILAFGGCWLVLSVAFRGEAGRAVGGLLFNGTVRRGGRRAAITALADTGHTLTDGGAPVVTVYWQALEPLWSERERAVLRHLEREGAVWCMERLGPGFRLLPYEAVGQRDGLLLCCKVDAVTLGGEDSNEVTVALSPWPVGSGWDALWNGEGWGEEKRNAA